MSVEHTGDRRNPEHSDTAGDPVKIEIVSCDGGRRTIDGAFGPSTSGWLSLRVSERIAPSTAVSVEHDDVLLVGEVAASEQEEDGSWRLRIQVKHKLTNLQSLMLLRSALLGRASPSSLNGMETLVSRS